MALTIGLCAVLVAAFALWSVRRLTARDERPSVDDYHHGLEVLADVAARSAEEPVEVAAEPAEGPTGNVHILSDEEFSALPAAVRRRASRPAHKRRGRGARSPGRGSAAATARRRKARAAGAEAAGAAAGRVGDAPPILITAAHDAHAALPELRPLPAFADAEGRARSAARQGEGIPPDLIVRSNTPAVAAPAHERAATPAGAPAAAMGEDAAGHESASAEDTVRVHGPHRRRRRRRRDIPLVAAGRRRLPGSRNAARPRAALSRHGRRSSSRHVRSVVATAAAGVLVLGVGAAFTMGRSRSPAPASRSHDAHPAQLVAPATARPTPDTSAPAALAVTPASDEPATFTVATGGSALQLEVATTARCWLSVRDGGRGAVAYSGVVEAGQPLRLQLLAPATLRLGAPWNAEVTVDGQRVALPAAAGPINLRFEPGGGPPPPAGGAAHSSGPTAT